MPEVITEQIPPIPSLVQIDERGRAVARIIHPNGRLSAFSGESDSGDVVEAVNVLRNAILNRLALSPGTIAYRSVDATSVYRHNGVHAYQTRDANGNLTDLVLLRKDNADIGQVTTPLTGSIEQCVDIVKAEIDRILPQLEKIG